MHDNRRYRSQRISTTSSDAASFRHLPVELAEHILSYCCQSELYAISCVSKTLYKIAIPFLYRHVDVRIKNKERIRIDNFYFNIAQDPSLVKYVRSLHIGSMPGYEYGIKPSFRRLPKAQEQMYAQAVRNIRQSERWLHREDLLKDETEHSYNYRSFAVLVLYILPALRRLELFEFIEPITQHPLAKILSVIGRNHASRASIQSEWLSSRLTSIQEIIYNFDGNSGLQSSTDWGRLQIDAIFYLPGIRKLELYVFRAFSFAMNYQSPTSITSLTLRRLNHVSQILHPILSRTPQLQCLTCDLCYGPNRGLQNGLTTQQSLNLDDLNDALYLVKDTIRILALSVECYDETKAYYEPLTTQPEFRGSLDLVEFLRLHTLEAPVPFITGDYNFSIVASLGFRLPPSIRHLALRTDITALQFIFPQQRIHQLSLDTATQKAKFELSARMDMAYLFKTTHFFLDQLTQLESISIWQPADPSLSWCDSQLKDFAIACKNKSITGKMIYPQIYRQRSPKHWNVVKEMTLFDPYHSSESRFEQVFRGERSGTIPLGLATFYQLSKFSKGEVNVGV